jgi:hypothetical protein
VTTRRVFFGSLGAGLLGAALTAHAQPAAKSYRLGFLSAGAATGNPVSSRSSGKGCASSDGSRARRSWSTIVGRRADSTGGPISPPNWSGSRWT